VRRFLKNRKTVVALVCLLAVVLFVWTRHRVRSKFESARDTMVATFADQLGVTINYTSITRRGANTLVITGLSISLPDTPGDRPFLSCARAEAEGNMWALLRGKPALRRVAVFEPELRLVLDADGRVALPRGLTVEPDVAAEQGIRLFRSGIELSIEDGTLTFVDERRDVTLVLKRVEGVFETGDRTGFRLTGRPADVPLGRLSIATAESGEAFAVTADSLPAGFVDKWLLNGAGLLRAGQIDVDLAVRLAETGDVGVLGTIRFHRLDVKQAPDYLEPLTGTARIDLTRFFEHSNVVVRSASVETDSVAGAVEGEIAVHDGSPTGELTARITRFPFERVIEPVVADLMPGVVRPRVRFNRGSTLTVRIELPVDGRVPGGRVVSPGWRCSGTAAGNAFRLEFGETTVEWNPDGENLSASAMLQGGIINPARLDETIRVPHGTVDVDGSRIQFGSIEFTALGGSVGVSGSVSVEEPPTFELQYEAERIDAGRFGKAVGADRLFAGGRCDVRGKVYGSPERPVVTARLNVTDTRLRWNRWFEKPAGIMATGTVQYDSTGVQPYLLIENTELGDAALTGKLVFGKSRNVDQIDLTFDAANPVALSPLFNLPIDIDGRGAARFTVEYRRDAASRRVELVATADDVTTVPAGADGPAVSGKTVTFTVHPGLNGASTSYDIDAGQTEIPETVADMIAWLDAFRGQAAGSRHEFELAVTADSVICGRADAKNLYARFMSSPERFQCRSMTLAPYEGTLTAHYDLDRKSRRYTSDVTWKEVSLKQFLAWAMNHESHTEGDFAGEVNLSGRLGEPETRQGRGYMEVVRGTVDPVFLAARLGGTEPPTTPTPIQFDRLHTDIEIDGNTIRTPNITIDKPGVGLDGSGYVDMDGEAKYEISIVLSPEVQDEIPMIKKRQIIPVPRFARSDLPLRFEVRREAGAFTGSVEDRRLQVKLLERTVEVGGEAVDAGVKVLELPAQLLYEVLQYLPKPRRENSQ